MDEGEDEGEAHAVHKPERMYFKKLFCFSLVTECLIYFYL